MIKTGNILFFFLFLFTGICVQAAPVVQSTVDRNEMGLGDTFTLTVSVVSTSDEDIQEPRVPEVDGFDLLNSWQSTAVAQKLVSTPSGMQFETQRRKEFHFMLSPQRAGTLSLASIEVVVSGKVYRTQPIVIKVGAQSQGGPARRPQRPGSAGSQDPFEAMDQAEEDLFSQLLRQRQRLLQQQMGQVPSQAFQDESTGLPEAAFRSLPKNPNEAFFISVEVDKLEVYEGEQVTVNWYIYTRGAMETLDRLKFPSLRGFWKEIIEEVPSIQFTQEIVNGVPWKKALLASHALFPIKAGVSVIDEYKIKSRVRLMPAGNIGFLGKPFEYTKSSARVEIKVKPLPTEGRPIDFTGAVGQFEVQSAVENPQAVVNQPISLKVRFEGAGNAKVIDLPAINWPTGLEQYDTKSESKYFKNGRSFKEFEILVIPRQQGELEIPGLSVSMFDPQAKKYYTRTTQPIKLNVTNDPNAPVGSSSRLSEAGKPAAPIQTANQLPAPVMEWAPSSRANVLSGGWLWTIVYSVISCILLLKARSEFGWGQRRRSLKELVSRRYKTVEVYLGEGDFRKVGVEMTNIFYTLLGEVAGIGGASLEIERLLEMVPPSLRRDHGDQILKSFETFQTMSFAPEEMLGALRDKDAMKAHVDQAKKVIGAVIASLEKT